MSKAHLASATLIMVNQAKKHGLPSILKSGEVVGIILHNKQEVIVQDVYDVVHRKVVIKDGRGKQKKISLSSIRALKVSDQLAKQVNVA